MESFIVSGARLYRHLHVDLWVWLVVGKDKVVECEVVYLFHLSLDLQFREGAWCSLELDIDI